MIYVVRYEIRRGDQFVSMGERDVEVDDKPTVVSYQGRDGVFEDARDEIGTVNDPLIWQVLAKALVIPAGCHAVITDVKESP